MTTHASTADDIQSALADISLPDFGEPDYALTINTFDIKTEITTEHNIYPGDIIERNPPASKVSQYFVVIDLTDTDIIYYVPDNHRFASYPQEFLEEDITYGSVAYHKQIL